MTVARHDAPAFAAKIRDMLLDDFTNSREIRYPEWQQRSRLHRVKEWLWGRIEFRLAPWRRRRGCLGGGIAGLPSHGP